VNIATFGENSVTSFFGNAAWTRKTYFDPSSSPFTSSVVMFAPLMVIGDSHVFPPSLERLTKKPISRVELSFHDKLTRSTSTLLTISADGASLTAPTFGGTGVTLRCCRASSGSKNELRFVDALLPR